jgi:hypothetical protein
MSELRLTEQLDQAIDAMMAAGGVVPADVDAQVAELLGIAVDVARSAAAISKRACEGT